MIQMIARFLCVWLLVCPATGLCAGGAAQAEGYTLVIPPQYNGASDFCDGLAMVMIDEKWGFIDTMGKEVISPQYDDVGAFREELAAVQIGEKWGYIDKTGSEAIPPKYDEAYGFHDGLALVLLGSKWGFIDTAGSEVVPPRYDNAYGFRDGLAMVMVGGMDHPEVWDVVDGQKWGYIDKTGREVVPVEYDKVGEFHEGLACVIKDGKLGFVDETGVIVIPLTYESPLPSPAAWYQDIMPFFSEDLAAVWGGGENGDQYGYIDRNGKTAIPFAYGYAAPFSEGLAYVSKGASIWYESDGKVSDNGKFGYIDKAGQVVVPLEYDCSYVGQGTLNDWYFVDGLAQVSKKESSQWNAKYGLIDPTGKLVVPIRYHWLRRLSGGLSFAGYGEDYSGHGTWDSIGLIDETGREIVAVDHYAWIEDFSEGYAVVRYGGEGGLGMESKESKYGFIDTAGNEVVPCIFEYAGDFSEGLAAVLIDGKWGYISIKQ